MPVRRETVPAMPEKSLAAACDSAKLDQRLEGMEMSEIEALAALQKTQPPLTDEMKRLLDELHEILENPVVEAAFNTAVSQVSQFVEIGASNPWIGATTEYFEEYFRTWFTYLPVPGGGLGKIIPFSFFYLNNPSAYVFLNTLKSRRNPDAPYTTEIFNWIVAFVKERGGVHGFCGVWGAY